MTLDIALVLGLLAASLVLFVTEWIRMDLTALLVLSSLALLGLVSPADALSGFSNPAVITVWAMFIMSEGLTRAGIADQIGRQVMRMSGRSEVRMIAIFMLVGGVLSAFMNNIGVAALMLPVAVEVARHGGVAPSRVLLPLAYGTLLGGLITLIGTPPNLLASIALRDAGLPGFGFFDFAWIGVPILLVGTAFVALAGRYLLPRTDTTKGPTGQHDLRALYGLQERIVALRIPAGSLLAGRTLADSALASAAGLMVIALMRSGSTEALPNGKTVLQVGDVLLAQGRLDRFELLRRWSTLTVEREAPMLQEQLWEQAALAELVVAEDSPLVGQPLRHREFRERHAANVLAVRSAGEVRRTRLADRALVAGDHLLVLCTDEALQALREAPAFDGVARVTEDERREVWRLDERLFVLRVPHGSALDGTTLGENRIGDAFDFRLLGIFREGKVIDVASSDELVHAGDLLLIQGREKDMDVLRGLQQLERLDDATPYLGVFDEGQLDLVEATLHPHAQIDGKTVADLALGERYQVEVAAIWRNGRAHRSALGAMALQRGDALLIVGPRPRLAGLNTDHDLIVLNPVQAQPVDARKAPLAGALMVLTIARDISMLKGAEAVLRESEERLHGITTNMPGMVFQCYRHAGDDKLHFSYISIGAKRLLGVDAAQVMQDANVFTSLIIPDDARSFYDSMTQSQEYRSMWNWEGRLVTKDGMTKWINLRASSPRHYGEDAYLWEGVAINITENKISEEKLIQSKVKLRELSAHLESVREEERKRIAREIHDELGQALTALRMDISLARLGFGESNPQLMARLQSMNQLVDHTIKSVRHITSSLRPGALDLGIVAALEWLVEEFVEHTGIPCELVLGDGEFALNEFMATAVFRITQESLTNIARHAEATQVEIIVTRTEEHLCIEVSDNGKGFDRNLAANRKSFGLVGIGERVAMMDGDFELDSEPGRGTRIRVCVPMA